MGPWRFFLDFGRIAGVGRMRVQGALYEPAVPAAFLHYASHGHPCRQDLRSRRAVDRSHRSGEIAQVAAYQPHSHHQRIARYKGEPAERTQITAILNGKQVIAPPRDIQEVRNALAAYERFDTWRPGVEKDLLEAHRILMSDLIDEAGYYRRGGVGVMEGSQVIHMAPPAARVPALMGDLFQWLAGSDAHPLITSSVFHYEFEFIHPFADGNGRMGRLRQSLVLVTHHPPRPALPPFPLVVFGPKIAPPGEAPWIRSDRPLPEIFPWSWGLVSRDNPSPRRGSLERAVIFAWDFNMLGYFAARLHDRRHQHKYF